MKQQKNKMKNNCKCELDGFQGAITSQNCPIHNHNIQSSVKLEAHGTGWILTIIDVYSSNNIALTAEELKELKNILNNKIKI